MLHVWLAIDRTTGKIVLVTAHWVSSLRSRRCWYQVSLSGLVLLIDDVFSWGDSITVDIRQVFYCVRINSISLAGIFLRVLSQKIALIEDRLFISVCKSQGFTENWQPYIHSNQVTAFWDFEKFSVLKSVSKLSQKILFDFTLLRVSIIRGTRAKSSSFLSLWHARSLELLLLHLIPSVGVWKIDHLLLLLASILIYHA